MARPKRAPDAVPTERRILRESARLFSEYGVEGTGTRMIADAVGVKQPTLFHYFDGKTAIARRLVETRIAASPLLGGAVSIDVEEPPRQLYRVLRDEFAIELESEFDTRWMFSISPSMCEVLGEWVQALRCATDTFEKLIAAGIASGEFYPEHVETVLVVLDSVGNQAMFWRSGAAAALSPEAAAEVLMRMLVGDPRRLREIVRSEAPLLGETSAATENTR